MSPPFSGDPVFPPLSSLPPPHCEPLSNTQAHVGAPITEAQNCARGEVSWWRSVAAQKVKYRGNGLRYQEGERGKGRRRAGKSHLDLTTVSTVFRHLRASTVLPRLQNTRAGPSLEGDGFPIPTSPPNAGVGEETQRLTFWTWSFMENSKRISVGQRIESHVSNLIEPPHVSAPLHSPGARHHLELNFRCDSQKLAPHSQTSTVHSCAQHPNPGSAKDPGSWLT